MIIEFFGCEWNKCLTKLNTVLLKKKTCVNYYAVTETQSSIVLFGIYLTYRGI